MPSDKDKQKTIRRLRTLERSWPSGLMLFASASGGNLILAEGHPCEGGKVLETFYIPSDGGDPDWHEDTKEPKRLRKFAPPTKYADVGAAPPPRFTSED